MNLPSTPVKLPDLPYDYTELEPAISAEIMRLHHDKHHRAYVTNLNVALEQYTTCQTKGDLAGMIGQLQAIKFNGGGHVNHSHFWTSLTSPKRGGQLPVGKLADQIQAQFGDLETLAKNMGQMAAGIQGSGWAWLACCRTTKRLLIIPTSNQDTVDHKLFSPLLGIDVWEHAYYLQFKNARPEYLKAIWSCIHWHAVAERYTTALS